MLADLSSNKLASLTERTKADVVFLVMQWGCLIAGGLQLFLDGNTENVVSSLIVVMTSTLTIQYLARTHAFSDAPMSSLAILGMCITAQLASLMAQSLYLVPFTRFLRTPIATFSILGGVLILAILCHWAYRHLGIAKSARSFVTHRLLEPLGAFNIPSPAIVWTIGLTGTLATLTGSAEHGDVGGKFFQALSFLAWLPFLIPLYYRRHGRVYCDIRTQAMLIALYSLGLVAVGMGLNFRQVMLIGPVSGMLMYLIYVLQERAPATRSTYKKLILGAAIFFVALPLLADLATAMVLIREKRGTVSKFELIQETILTLADRHKLQIARDDKMQDTLTSHYDESYLSNPVLARFSETKFHDNMFFFSLHQSDSTRQQFMREMTDKLWTALPQPVLDLLDIKIDKSNFQWSMGDMHLFLAGTGHSLGGFATGSIWADLILMYDYWTPLFLIIALPVLFFVLDVASRKGDLFSITPGALCVVWVVFLYGLGGESIATKPSFFIRTWPQAICIYLMMYWGTNLALNFLKSVFWLNQPYQSADKYS